MDTFTASLRRDRSATLCAICSAPRPTRPYHLTHGLAVNLCVVHRSESYLRRRRGTVFTDALRQLWVAHGIHTTRRERALIHHRRRVIGTPADRPRPGSYAWPAVRRDAEKRFARGDDPGEVAGAIRRRLAGSVATAPALRTIRRWFTDGRWLAAPDDRRPARGRPRQTEWARNAFWLGWHPALPYSYFWPAPPWAIRERDVE